MLETLSLWLSSAKYAWKEFHAELAEDAEF